MSTLADRSKANLQNRTHKARILFTEGWNLDIQRAAGFLAVEGLLEPVVILRTASETTHLLDNVEKIILDEIDKQKYIDKFYELRKEKGATMEDAQKIAIEPNYISALMLKLGEADGCICGIEYSTKDTLRAALQIVKPRPGCKIVTSAMILEKGDEILIFGDISLSLNPNSEELASITKEVVLFAHDALGCENLNAAMLSYSTRGSGAGESVDKVKHAYEIVSKDQTLIDMGAKIFGEIQFDAAYTDKVRAKKAPDAPWDAKPAIYIFPTLDAGNIGYKIMERVAGYNAVGPVILGLDKPMNDLSRGASTHSVIGIAYITASQVKK